MPVPQPRHRHHNGHADPSIVNIYVDNVSDDEEDHILRVERQGRNAPVNRIQPYPRAGRQQYHARSSMPMVTFISFLTRAIQLMTVHQRHLPRERRARIFQQAHDLLHMINDFLVETNRRPTIHTINV